MALAVFVAAEFSKAVAYPTGRPNIIVVTEAVREVLVDVENVYMPALK